MARWRRRRRTTSSRCDLRGGFRPPPIGASLPCRYARGMARDTQEPSKSMDPASRTQSTALRRRGDALPPQTRTAAHQPRSPRAGGRLRTEILVPIGIGSIALAASVGIISSAANKLALPIIPVAVAGGVLLMLGLIVYVAWIVNGAALQPLERVR